MKRKGFTLIELIVVVTIIGILAAIILVSYNGVQKRARDSKRKADLNAIAAGMKIYYSDKKTFSMAGEAGGGTLGHFNYTPTTGGRPSFATYLQTNGYITNPPKDPKYEEDTQKYDYWYQVHPGNIAGIYAILEQDTVPNWDSSWTPSNSSLLEYIDLLNYGVKITP